MRSRCRRSIITTSASCSPSRMSVKDLDAHLVDARRQQRRRSDDADSRAEGVEEQDVGAGDAANAATSPQIATVRRAMLALVTADRQRIEQGLGRMLVRAVAGIDDRAGDLLREQCDGAGGMVAHDQQVGLHGVQRHRRIDQRFALLHRGVADRHVHDVGAEPLAGEFEGGLRPRRGLEEQVDLRASLQHRASSCCAGARSATASSARSRR